MFRLVRTAFNTGTRISTSIRVGTIAKREFTRNFIALCNQKDVTSAMKVPVNTSVCACGCGIRGAHSKGELELVEFLKEEIVAERKTIKTIPSELNGFKVKLDGADIELTKTTDNENINISFNVNHTVDTEMEPDIDASAKPDFAEMKSKPTFEIDIVRGNTTLSFTCSFLHGQPQEEEFNDVFTIDEITLFNDEHNDKTYSVAGDVLDGYLYDLLMNLLEEKGISNEFVEKLSDISTAYEHTAYVGLLEGLSKFTVGK